MAILYLFVALLALTVIDVPIAIGLGAVAVVGMVITDGPQSLLNVAVGMYNGTTSFPLLAIPLFILAGSIMNACGISRRLIAFASSLVGFVRGGLAMVGIATSMFFAEISGSAVADVAALGSILIPAMKAKGYPVAFAAAVESSSATLAVIIPPSIPMVLYAVMADTSIAKLFVAGIIPGVLGGLALMGVAHAFAVRNNWPVEERFRAARVWETFKEASWSFALPVIILGGIFGGVVTATEGAALAVLAALVIGAGVYRELDVPKLREAMVAGAVQTAVVMVLVATSTVMGTYLTELQAPQQLANTISGFTQNRYLILLLLNVLFLFLGCFLHSAAAITLVVPIVMPLVRSAGIDPIHFGLIVTINLGIGQQTPPVASVLTTACAIAHADVWEVTRVNVWFIGVLLGVLFLCTYVPAIPMSLVQYVYK
ncbi:MAG: TRAP transporter large permease [Anaeromyxobacteraceae bacterium]